jgi:RNA polymerase sigma factor (sigma-70 family)
MDSQQELGILLQRIRDGSQEAAQELCRRYEAHVLRVLRRKLSTKLRAKLDSMDLAQDVWASFFVDARHQFDFERPEDLIAFLAKLAQNKLVDTLRQRCRTQKYNINREHPLEGSAAGEAGNVADRRPTPSQVAIAQEKWEQLLHGQPPRSQRILLLLREGHTHQEVARQVGVNEKTVRRLLRKLAPEAMP